MSTMKRSAPTTNSPARPAKRQQSLASFFATPEKKPDLLETVDIKDEPLKLEVDLPPLAADGQITKPSISTLDKAYPLINHPSYHPPPSPTFNHPFPIAPIPCSLNLRFNTTPNPHLNPKLGLDLLYFKRFIDPACSWELTRYLLDALPWYRVKYTVRGLDINTPRFTTVFGKDSTNKSWTSYPCKPRAIPPILLKLMQKGKRVRSI